MITGVLKSCWLNTTSALSFPEDSNPRDEWAWGGEEDSTVRAVADPIWNDYCTRRRMEWPLYHVTLLDGTLLDLDKTFREQGLSGQVRVQFQRGYVR